MITKKNFVILVISVARAFVPLWLAVGCLLVSIEASKPLQATPAVRWPGRLIVAISRRVEGGAEDGERRAALLELTMGSDGVSRTRPLLPGEIEADYQLSPDTTQIAFRPTDGRHVELLDLTTHDRWRLAFPDGALDSAAVVYGWCVDAASLWVRSGSALYLARTSPAGPAKLIANAAGIEACTSQVAVVVRDADQRVASALSVDSLRQLRAVPPLSYTFSDRHICWRESFALETLGQAFYGIGRREVTGELRPSTPDALTPAGGATGDATGGAALLELGLSAFVRPGCLLGAVGPRAVHVLEIRGHQVLERGRYADQPELYAALSRTRDQPVWLGGPERRVVAYVDPDCQRKVIVRDLETRLTDAIWPAAREGDCGESVPLGWASDRVVALSWLP